MPLLWTRTKPTPVVLFDIYGEPMPAAVTPTAPAERTVTVLRVASGATTVIAAGSRYYRVDVITAGSAVTPTFDGVSIPAGAQIVAAAPPGDTLNAASVVTESGDDVLITTIT